MYIEKSNTKNPEDVYDLVFTPNAKSLRDYKGTTIYFDTYAKWVDENGDGECRDLLSLQTKDGSTICTNSKTFIKDFMCMINLFEQAGVEVTAVDVLVGKSNKGREFMMCRKHRD